MNLKRFLIAPLATIALLATATLGAATIINPGGSSPKSIGALAKNENLKDVESASSSRINLGLGTAAVEPVTAFDAAGQAATAQTAAEAKASSQVKTEEERAVTAETGRLVKTENLKDLTNPTAAQEHLELLPAHENAVLGKGAFAANTTGEQNTVNGDLAMEATKTASKNVVSGYRSLKNGTGEQNVVTGNNDMVEAETASKNVATGNSTLTHITTGERNAATGFEDMVELTTGTRNTGNGYAALNDNKTGSENVADGTTALGEPVPAETSVSKNVAVGFKAGAKIKGNSNVVLGFESGAKEEGSNKLYIANTSTATPLLLGDFEAKTLKVNGTLTATAIGEKEQALVLKGLVDPGEAAAKPAKPAEGAVTESEEATSHKKTFAIFGTAAKKNWTLKPKFGTKLLQVSVQKAVAEEPRESEPTSAYTFDATSAQEVEVKFTAAPAKEELLHHRHRLMLDGRQLQVMRLLADGLEQKEIAARLGISHGTVRQHLHAAYRKLGAHNAATAVAAMYKHQLHQLLPEPEPPGDEGPLPPAQKAYLAAFDRHLAACSPGEEALTRAEMTAMLPNIYIEARKPPPGRQAVARRPRHHRIAA